MLLFLLLLGLLAALSGSQADRGGGGSAGDLETPPDRDLVGALEALLDQLDPPVSSPEKRGSIPLCGTGSRCLVKMGPRIGRLCDCRGGASCNSYLLRCI
ncbi:cocaine- and amphetamine-regulated transcript protein-like [Menidia menidia]